MDSTSSSLLERLDKLRKAQAERQERLKQLVSQHKVHTSLATDLRSNTAPISSLEHDDIPSKPSHVTVKKPEHPPPFPNTTSNTIPSRTVSKSPSPKVVSTTFIVDHESSEPEHPFVPPNVPVPKSSSPLTPDDTFLVDPESTPHFSVPQKFSSHHSSPSFDSPFIQVQEDFNDLSSNSESNSESLDHSVDEFDDLEYIEQEEHEKEVEHESSEVEYEDEEEHFYEEQKDYEEQYQINEEIYLKDDLELKEQNNHYSDSNGKEADFHEGNVDIDHNHDIDEIDDSQIESDYESDHFEASPNHPLLPPSNPPSSTLLPTHLHPRPTKHPLLIELHEYKQAALEVSRRIERKQNGNKNVLVKKRESRGQSINLIKQFWSLSLDAIISPEKYQSIVDQSYIQVKNVAQNSNSNTSLNLIPFSCSKPTKKQSISPIKFDCKKDKPVFIAKSSTKSESSEISVNLPVKKVEEKVEKKEENYSEVKEIKEVKEQKKAQNYSIKLLSRSQLSLLTAVLIGFRTRCTFNSYKVQSIISEIKELDLVASQLKIDRQNNQSNESNIDPFEQSIIKRLAVLKTELSQLLENPQICSRTPIVNKKKRPVKPPEQGDKPKFLKRGSGQRNITKSISPIKEPVINREKEQREVVREASPSLESNRPPQRRTRARQKMEEEGGSERNHLLFDPASFPACKESSIPRLNGSSPFWDLLQNSVDLSYGFSLADFDVVDFLR
ncbi:hypothetical protein RCL1_004450 [Eukaryota sp. TZLM3-RCL]